jgi:hypothetical protein
MKHNPVKSKHKLEFSPTENKALSACCWRPTHSVLSSARKLPELVRRTGMTEVSGK